MTERPERKAVFFDEDEIDVVKKPPEKTDTNNEDVEFESLRPQTKENKESEKIISRYESLLNTFVKQEVIKLTEHSPLPNLDLDLIFDAKTPQERQKRFLDFERALNAAYDHLLVERKSTTSSLEMPATVAAVLSICRHELDKDFKKRELEAEAEMDMSRLRVFVEALKKNLSEAKKERLDFLAKNPKKQRQLINFLNEPNNQKILNQEFGLEYGVRKGHLDEIERKVAEIHLDNHYDENVLILTELQKMFKAVEGKELGEITLRNRANEELRSKLDLVFNQMRKGEFSNLAMFWDKNMDEYLGAKENVDDILRRISPQKSMVEINKLIPGNTDFFHDAYLYTGGSKTEQAEPIGESVSRGIKEAFVDLQSFRETISSLLGDAMKKEGAF